MTLKKCINREKYRDNQPCHAAFFHYSSLSFSEQDDSELQKVIQEKKDHIVEIEDYILHALEPIENNIKRRQEYKKELKSELNRASTQIEEKSALLNVASIEMKEKAKLLKATKCLSTKKKQLELKLQQTKDLLIEYDQNLAEIKKEIEYWEGVLPNEKKALRLLQTKLAMKLVAPIAREIERHLGPAA